MQAGPQSDRSQKSNEQDKLKIRYIFESLGDNLHYLYKQQSTGFQDRSTLVMNAVDQRNLCMKTQVQIYKGQHQVASLQRKENVLECLFYPVFTNRFTIKKGHKEIGVIKETHCRMCLPFYCCGKIQSCSNQTFEIYNTKQKCIFTVEGNFECIVEACSKFIVYHIYADESRDPVGRIREVTQICNLCPCHCSCYRLYSPLLKRTFYVDIQDDVVHYQDNMEYLFSSLVFLAKVTRSYFY